MGIVLLKTINTKLPESIKQLLAPIIRRRLIYGKPFQKQLTELKNMDSATTEELEKEQFRRLKETLIHAYEHTRYYHRIFKQCGFDPFSFKDVQELLIIPELTKSLIIENYDDLQADDITDYYSATTGGSTGVPLKINLDRESIYRERAFIYHFWGKHGYNYKTSKIASFRGTDFDGKISKLNPLYAEIQMNPCTINAETIEQYIKLMDNFGVEFLHGFPSAIYSFCKYSKQAKINLKRKYKAVFLISENVYEFQKKMMEETLECKLYPFYGHTERAVFAEQNNDMGYTFNPLYGYVEINENSNIICTGFVNKKMPLIRYCMDDCAEKQNGYYHIKGHREGGLYGKNNEIISAAMLEVHSKLLDKIANYQFVQDRKGEVLVRIIPFDKLTKEDEAAIRELFQKKIGNSIKVTIKVIERLDYTARGKYKLIIQKYKVDEHDDK